MKALALMALIWYLGVFVMLVSTILCDLCLCFVCCIYLQDRGFLSRCISHLSLATSPICHVQDLSSFVAVIFNDKLKADRDKDKKKPKAKAVKKVNVSSGKAVDHDDGYDDGYDY